MNGKTTVVPLERRDDMSRGEHFNHKNKQHPGEYPKDNGIKAKATEAQEDEEFLVVQEAFKNRVGEDEDR